MNENGLREEPVVRLPAGYLSLEQKTHRSAARMAGRFAPLSPRGRGAGGEGEAALE